MARSHRRLAFWVAVGGVSILAQTIFNVASDRLPVQGLKELNAYNTRKNG